MSRMIRLRLDELRLKKKQETGAQKLPTLQEIASASGVSDGTMFRLNSGRSTAITFDVMDALCGYFNCEPGEIFARVPDSNK